MDDEILYVDGPEQSLVDVALPDGGLPPAVGVQSWQVFRASRDVPELTDGRGWTYHHHVDMACWRGRLVVGWNSCERDEDVWPSRELYSSSVDGATWTEPQELFPQGISTPLRMYFYRAPNDRMLAIAGLRTGTADTREDAKDGLVVREILDDHRLGPVFTLQPTGSGATRGPSFNKADDPGFVAACRALLADTVFLEQQDLGRLLGERRMKWHDPAAWPDGRVPGDSDKWRAGKAFSFFRRPDGAIVGVSKMGWTTISRDAGRSWTQPLVPPTLVTGKAKVWAQRTADGRYALVYNPSRRTRFPLAVVTSDDGVRFSGMRIVQGELPIQRYEGRARSVGPQYVRGVSHWSDDGSRAGEQAMWLVYSMSKEDIWVSRVPLPVRGEARDVDVDVDVASMDPGPLVPGWNTYAPKWANVGIVADGATRCLRLHDRDPYDYARAVRVFTESARATVAFEVRPGRSDGGALEIELLPALGAARPVRVTLTDRGTVAAVTGGQSTDIGTCAANQWLPIVIDADATRGTFSVTLAGRRVLVDAAFAEPSAALHRISFRTAPHRGIGGTRPVPPGTDRPTPAITYDLRALRVHSDT